MKIIKKKLSNGFVPSSYILNIRCNNFFNWKMKTTVNSHNKKDELVLRNLCMSHKMENSIVSYLPYLT